MSNLNAFLSQNAIKVENEKHVISNRFKDENGKLIPFEFRALTEAENERIRKSCTKKIKSKGVVSTDIKFEDYIAKLAVESVVFPNLKDKELQESYGAMGAENLLKVMLTTGEYATLMEKVQKINGFDIDDEEIIEEAKN